MIVPGVSKPRRADQQSLPWGAIISRNLHGLLCDTHCQAAEPALFLCPALRRSSSGQFSLRTRVCGALDDAAEFLEELIAIPPCKNRRQALAQLCQLASDLWPPRHRIRRVPPSISSKPYLGFTLGKPCCTALAFTRKGQASPLDLSVRLTCP